MDLNPQYSRNDLLIHYGSPVISRVNTILVPVKTGATDGFRIDARRATDGSLIWSIPSDYSVPAHNWLPSFGITLTPKDRYLAYPGAGGTVLLRTFPDSAAGTTTRVAFYGLNNYAQNPAAFDASIKICTPISSDKVGNLFFGYVSTGVSLPGYPTGIPSGFARISSVNVGSFVSAVSLAADPAIVKVAYNCAPGFSLDGSKVYVAVNTSSFGSGYLCAVNSTTLAPLSRGHLMDPLGGLSLVPDDGSAAPTIGPDDDVYYGVIEANFPVNHARGWLLHYDSTLAVTKIPNAFGWDDTASVVPASAVPSYVGSSSYLLLTKFNNYAGAGGDGVNRLALVDPNATMTDPFTGATVMKTVLAIAGPTPDPEYGGVAVREWCINSAAIDPVTHSAVVNNEDGRVYRWDFNSNTLSPGVTLAAPTGEAYTPTLIGPDGAIYAINNAVLSCVIAN